MMYWYLVDRTNNQEKFNVFKRIKENINYYKYLTFLLNTL